MIVALQGGLGNQMFQLAFGMAQAQRLGCRLYLNTTRFSPTDPCRRRYALELWRGVNFGILNRERNHVHEQGLPYNAELLTRIQPDSTLVGYWQTEKYFQHLAAELREVFVPRRRLTARGQDTLRLIQEAGDRSVFLTVRRSDYLTSDFHGVLGMDYYQAALAEILKVQSQPVVFVFSDEPDWCRDNFRLWPAQVIAGTFDRTDWHHLGREDEDLTLMRHCKHAILANSSFSWWGRWLHAAPGVTVAPQRWFLSDKEDPRDICPEHWIRL